MHTAAYNTYMISPAWKAFRLRIIAQRGRKCERCGSPARVLQLHHLTYVRLGQELDSDVQLLCIDCHRTVDPKWAIRI